MPWLQHKPQFISKTSHIAPPSAGMPVAVASPCRQYKELKWRSSITFSLLLSTIVYLAVRTSRLENATQLRYSRGELDLIMITVIYTATRSKLYLQNDVCRERDRKNECKGTTGEESSMALCDYTLDCSRSRFDMAPSKRLFRSIHFDRACHLNVRYVYANTVSSSKRILNESTVYFRSFDHELHSCAPHCLGANSVSSGRSGSFIRRISSFAHALH
jgi:hypothetical protein